MKDQACGVVYCCLDAIPVVETGAGFVAGGAEGVDDGWGEGFLALPSGCPFSEGI